MASSTTRSISPWTRRPAYVIGFRPGYGDGTYPSWFGLDANGRPLVLLTDFGILDAPTS